MHNETLDSPLIDDAVASRNAKKALRRRRFALLFGALGVVAISALVRWWSVARFYEDTDDAYVAGNVVQIAAQIPGTVADVLAENTQRVRAGEMLVKLDDTEVTVALAQARAQLAQAVRQAREARAADAQLAEAVKAREAELELARGALAAREGASADVVSPEELAHAREAVAVARANLAAVRAQLAGAMPAAGRTQLADDPLVVQAADALRLAYANCRHASVASPITGVVAQRSVQIGQRVGPGVPLMSVIALDGLWVEANFKEGQLRDMRIGQPVRVSSDVYGSRVVYHGHVQGFSPGTGSAFSMLPPQNAAGNWTKVVQRVPVVIGLDAAELAAHPLRLGLSMQVSVDTHERGGAMTKALRSAAAGDAVRGNDTLGAADALIAQIIEQNR